MIPVNEPSIRDQDIAYVLDALRTGWISSEGKYIAAFEEQFAAASGREFGVAVNNGTSALILALRSLDLPPGSEVIMPSFTIISCALACIYNDLVPLFVDSDSVTWNMDLDQVSRIATKSTRAIMPVHIYGYPVDMDRLSDLALSNRWKIVEDFAEAIGSEFSGKKCGSFGDVSCASFYANKVITTGEGGMCLTDDPALADRLRLLRNLAFRPGQRFVHDELGFNFRMTNVQAAIGLAQTQRIAEHVSAKIEMGITYDRLLAPLEEEGLAQLPPRSANRVNTYWMYGLVLSDRVRLDAPGAMRLLSEKGVATRPFFFPMHQQPAFRRFSWFTEQNLPVSTRLYERGFYLPSGLTLTTEQMEEVAAAVLSIVRGNA